jgi:LuxR family transcriptional regulator, maltose regulon positive regulatory protein
MSTSEAAATQRDALLATKLHVPRTRLGFVARPRLVDRLAQAQGGELTLVCAPAGFGKTALLADWARGGQRPVAWLSLDTGDNDPVRFWRHVAAALDRVRAGVGERVAGLLRPPPRSFEAVITALVNELTTQPNEVALVLDDYHLVHAPPVHGSLVFLLEHLPPSLCLVLAGRADPPLPLARLRARGQLTELRAGDLRFSPEEAAALLRSAVGPDLPEAAVAALADRTEGWVAGLQLAALSLQGRTDIAAFVAGFSGSHRYVMDYLAEEVLDRQPEPLRGFLLETSVLERLCGPLCDAVTGRGDSQQLLEQVERANLFLVPLDEVRGWWRYHHLFADLLRARLQQQPERVAELHRAAAAWHEAHGFADEAVSHTLAAGEVGWAARLVERHIEGLLRRSEGATLGRWLAALPAEAVDSRARLCLAQAVAAVVVGQLEAVEPLLAAAEHALATIDEEPHQPSVGRALSVLANVPASIAFLRAELARFRGDAERAVAFDRQALSHLDEGDWLLRSQVRWNLAGADWLRGRLTRAEHALAEVVAERRAAGEGFMAMLVGYDLGQVQRAQGRLGAALASYQRWLEPAGQAGHQPPHAGMAHVGVAEVLYERDELDAAHTHATQAVALCRQLAFTQPLVSGLGVLARIRQAQGDAASALEAIGQAQRVGLSPQVVALLNPVPVWRARLWLARGEVAEAARWVEGRGLRVTDEPSYPREGEYLVLARVLLAQRQPDRALGLLERLHAQAAAQGRTGSVIEVRALQALALQAASDRAGALAALAEVLALAGPEGYLRVFVDEGAPMARLLGRLAAAQRAGHVALPAEARPDYLDRLALAFQPRRARADAGTTHQLAGVAGLVEPLSDRELQVLGLLAVGRSNQQIADELVVVLDTVKKHVGHILDKLGAANRTQAVARARALGLLR